MQNLTTTDLFIAFFSGVGATLIGFLLSIFWERHKRKQEEEAIFDTIKRILTTNVTILENNRSTVDQEIKALENRKSVVNPLNTTMSDFMSFLAIHMPKIFKKNPEVLEELNSVAMLLRNNNETINSRESYRLSNGAMSNYFSRMAIYGDIILKQTTELIKSVRDLLMKLG